MMNSGVHMALAALLALFTGACASTSQVALAPVWPSAPAIPRIQFIASLTGPGDVDKGILRRILRTAKGEHLPALAKPHGLAVDGDTLYVVDSHLAIVHVFDRGAGRYRYFPKRPTIDGFTHPIGVAVASSGRVFVSDAESGRVHVFEAGGRQYLGSLGEGLLKRPTGLTLTPDSRLLVVDTVASTLLAFDPATLDHLSTTGRSGKGEDGFHYPTDVAVGPDGTIYVADTLNFRIQVIDPEGAFIDSFGAAGDAPGYFSRPKAVAVDSDGNIYAVDALFDNVQIFSHDGDLLFGFGGPGNGPGQFWLPNAITIDRANRIYISDPHNGRVQIFQYLTNGAVPEGGLP